MLSSADPTFQLKETIEAKYREQCRAFQAEFDIDDQHLHIEEGPADVLIPFMARKLQAAVTVIGTVARSGLSGVLIGNTAEAVLDTLESDVLVLKPQEVEDHLVELAVKDLTRQPVARDLSVGARLARDKNDAVSLEPRRRIASKLCSHSGAVRRFAKSPRHKKLSAANRILQEPRRDITLVMGFGQKEKLPINGIAQVRQIPVAKLRHQHHAVGLRLLITRAPRAINR